MASYLPTLRLASRTRVLPVLAQLRPAITPSQLSARAVRPFSVSSAVLAKDVFIAGLHYETTEDKLKEFLASYGDVSNVKLVIDNGTRLSRGFGFATYNNDAEADRAVNEANGVQLDGRVVKVAHKTNNRRGPVGGERPQRETLPVEKDLYIGGLDYAATEDEVRAMFAKYGELETVRVVADKVTGQGKGYGFVKFKASDAAQKAQAELDGQESHGRRLRVMASRPTEAKQPSQMLFVRALKPTTSAEQIQAAFAKHGTVSEVRLVNNPLTHQPRGMAVVTFNLLAEAEKAKSAMNGADIDGSAIAVDYNQPRERTGRMGAGRSRDFSPRGGDRGDRGNGFGGRSRRDDRDRDDGGRSERRSFRRRGGDDDH